MKLTAIYWMEGAAQMTASEHTPNTEQMTILGI